MQVRKSNPVYGLFSSLCDKKKGKVVLSCGFFVLLQPLWVLLL